MWIKVKQTVEDRVSTLEWFLDEEWCDLLCFLVYYHHLFPSPNAFTVLAFLEAVQAASHVKLGRPAFVTWFNCLKPQLKHFVQDFYLHGTFM